MIKEIILCSLFNIRRAYGPLDIDFTTTSREVPYPPQPVSAGPQSLLSGAASWFGMKGSLTGEQIDVLCEFEDSCCSPGTLIKGLHIISGWPG